MPPRAQCVREPPWMTLANREDPMRPTLRLAFATSSLILLAPPPASGQTTSPPAPAAQDQPIADIVVTAQKREQRLQDVPITITAPDAKQLKNADIRSTADLTQVVPGLRANVQAGYFQPYIRGVGGSSTLPGNESPVALYIDGFYVSLKEANNFELSNIERIEVLKGPQGTLFGRNATGGAINIITRAPSDHLEVRADASYGRFDEVILNGYAAGPITDTLSASASIRYQNIGDGYQHNITTGTAYGTLDSLTAMGKLRWEPSSKFTLTGEMIYTHRRAVDDDQGTANAAVVPKAAATPGAVISYTPYVLSNNYDPLGLVKDYKWITNARLDLGGATLTNIAGYEQGDSIARVERDRSSASLQQTESLGYARTLSEELQLASSGSGPLTWMLGAYYFHNKEGYRYLDVLLNIPHLGSLADIAAAYGVPGSSYTRTVSAQYVDSLAGYADATWTFAPETHLTAGIRYTTEKRRLLGTSYAVTAPPPGTALVYTPLAHADLSKRFAQPSWRAVLDHRFSPALMVYASYNRGFRSGAYNPSSISATQIPLNPEVIDAYEVGLKSDLFDRRLRFNLAGFYYNYRDLHVSVRTPSTGAIVQQNAGGAEIYGLDMDFTAQPVANLTLTGGVNLLHARYTDYANASTYVIDTVHGGGVQITVPNAAGQPLSYAPNWTANLGVDYVLPLGRSSLKFAGNYFITDGFSRQVGVVLGQEEVRSYDTLNASVTWQAPSDRYYVSLWGRNLTNQKVLGSTLDSYDYFYLVQRPVTYGVTLGFCFGGHC